MAGGLLGEPRTRRRPRPLARHRILEDRLALLGGLSAELPVERDVSLRLLRHLATSVRHQKYHDTDIVTVRVDPVGAKA